MQLIPDEMTHVLKKKIARFAETAAEYHKTRSFHVIRITPETSESKATENPIYIGDIL
jgi:hypothetical protein